MDSIVDEKGKRLVVRNGYHKERVIQMACGNVKVRLPRVDDRKATERFVSRILPPFVRKTPTVETLIAALYLAGVSSNTIIRMTREWSNEFQEWKKRDLTGKEYVYVKSRPDGEKTCLLVLLQKLTLSDCLS